MAGPIKRDDNPAHNLYIAESDGGSFVVRSHVDKDVEEVVAWSISDAIWSCSCGDQPSGVEGLSRCGHIQRVGYCLPYDVAMALGQQVSRGRLAKEAAKAKAEREKAARKRARAKERAQEF